MERKQCQERREFKDCKKAEYAKMQRTKKDHSMQKQFLKKQRKLRVQEMQKNANHAKKAKNGKI